MATLSEIRAELKARISTAVPELHTYDVIPGAVVTPAAVVQPARTFATYPTRFRSQVAEWRLEVLLLTGRIAEHAAQELLDTFASPGSPLIPAIQAAGGPVQVATVREGRNYGSYRVGEADYLGFVLLVEITA